jgi:photosystem II stability/assembly factor-like uncharacterized protein
VSNVRRWTFLSLLLIAFMSSLLVAQQKSSTPAKAKQEVEKRKESTAPKKGEQPSENAPAGKAAKDEEKPKDPMSSGTFSGLKLRSIGPAITSGRVLDIAVNPKNRAQWYVATVGGVWKTNNAGITWSPIFDGEGSFSIANVVIDPNDSNVIWVGSGENNSQRSVSYGDGVYRSEDGGKSWKNMGLKHSEHIGKIIVDPRDSNKVFVAAQGPLWGPGGDRGLYKTTDGGKSWKQVLKISEHTGVTDLAIDPEAPDTMYAASYQRERHVYTVIDGGPESAIYKSTDGGETWNKLKSGLPTNDMGKIGLAVAPSNPNYVYAYIEGQDGKGGIFRSTDKGATWERRNPYDTTAQYYAEIFVDPKNPERIYYPNLMVNVSDDGGKTIRPLNTRSKHVDNHVVWIDPNDTNYYLVGCDGGVYESYDRGETWAFKANLPITQFYDVAVSAGEGPFYTVCGGTQDNYSLCGPSRTRNVNGIQNSDWYVTQGGDGFTSRVDPQDPNTIYAEAQYGGLVRFDRRTGERLSIQPAQGKGEAPSRWNWDSPLIISPHSHTRLYFASQRLYRSDDRGDSWKAVSGDLTKQVDRNKLPVMGKVWGPDAVAKNASTSFYGNIVALAESPKKEGLIYVGTDDGLVQITEDGGAHWTKYDKFAGVPDTTYVSRLFASNHDANTVFATFDHHKESDFKPYILKSTDAGKTWTSISSNLPENGPVLAFAEDTVNPHLLFAGTEFGLWFSVDDGKKWIQLKGGLPTISVHDITIHPTTGDVVLASFGRGFYILDDPSVLRDLKPEQLQSAAVVYPQRDTLMYIESSPIGGRGKGFLGDQHYFGDNPPYGATFTYYLKDAYKSKKEQRQEVEKKADKENKLAPYPSNDELRAEADEEAPSVFLTVVDADGNPLRRVGAVNKAGMNRVAWDLRYPSPILAQARPESEGDEDFFGPGSLGALVLPGKYGVILSKKQDGKIEDLTKPIWFNVVAEGTSGMNEQDRQALLAFQQKVSRLYRSFNGASRTTEDLRSRMKQIKRALNETPAADRGLTNRADDLEARLNKLAIEIRGDSALEARNENVPASISDRIQSIIFGSRMSTSRPTQTNVDNYNLASQEYTTVLAALKQIAETDLPKLENDMEKAGAPWTPGRMPTYTPE